MKFKKIRKNKIDYKNKKKINKKNREYIFFYDVNSKNQNL